MITWYVRAYGLNSLVDHFNIKTHDIWKGKRDNKDGDLSWEHPLPSISRYKRKVDIKEGDIMEVMVYVHPKIYDFTKFGKSTKSPFQENPLL